MRPLSPSQRLALLRLLRLLLFLRRPLRWSLVRLLLRLLKKASKL
jgi:hypothetical protein